MDKTRIASAVAGDLFATEAAIEDALARAARLLRGMVEARRSLGLPAATGDAALRRVTATVEALGAAQQEMVATHGVLEALRQDLGLPGLAFGPLIKPAGRIADDLTAG